MPEPRQEGLAHRLLRQFQSPLIYLLLIALGFDLIVWLSEGAHDWPIESTVIALILLLNAGLGVFQEYRSERALARLGALTAPRSWVVRGGELVRIPSRELVPGDLVRIDAGDRVPADGSLLGSEGVLADESMLTGESVPVEKTPGDEVLSGTLVVRGTAYAEIRRTGPASAMGRLAALLGTVEATETPLERHLDQFGRQVMRWIVALAALLTIGGLLVEGPDRFAPTLLFAVALAVAAVPEGLPAVLTLALALGVERMAKRRAVVRRLAAVEALGSVTVIATDKTGTLTENRMEVRAVDSPDRELAHRALVLANDAESSGVGDPLEVALLTYAGAQGLDPAVLRLTCPRVGSRPFDSVTKFMRVTVLEADRVVSYLKGAPGVLLARSDLGPDHRQSWSEKTDAYARQGYRVLGVGWAPGHAEQGLTFLGLTLLWDPPRSEVPDAIAQARAAGIRVVMVTGDHPATALAVAQAVGIPGDRVLTGADLEDLTPEAIGRAVTDVNVFARVSPEDKLRLVESLRARGEIVAVTGDGVNDAPALKRSDVGIAMGQRGSDVAREAADLVLQDDNFATIVAAIEEGRSIYENVQKFIRFLFSTNLAEVLIVALGALGSVALGLREPNGSLLVPLTAVQILWVNLITDGLPALALALDRNPGVMNRSPRSPDTPLLDVPSLRYVLPTGTIKALIALVGLIVLPWSGLDELTVRSAVFQFVAISQLLMTYPARHTSGQAGSNPVLHLAVGLGLALQGLVGSVPAFRLALGLEPLDLWVWAVIGGASLVVWGICEGISRWARDRN